MTRQEAETALDNGTLEVLIHRGVYWRARRNGATKTWKTRPNEWRIPIKAGLRSHAYLSDLTVNLVFDGQPNYRIRAS